MRFSVLVLGGLMVLGGCSDDVTGPEETPVATHTVDASTDWVFVRMAATPTTVEVADPTTSGAWDLGFYATSVRVNGEAAGPGEVETFCICQNEGATSEDIQTMSPESELADFMAVTADDIPTSAAAWDSGAEGEGGVFDTHRWYRYNLTGEHQVWPTFQVYLVRRGSEVFKVQVIGYYGAAGEVRQISFRSSKIAG